MPIIGMSYTKIHGERTGAGRNMSVKTIPTIVDVKKTKLGGLGKEVDVLNITFSFKSEVEPKIGIVEIEGSIVYNTTNVDKVLNKWKKDKKLPKENEVEILNHIFRKVSIQALNVADALQLPPIISLPRVVAEEK